MPVRPAPRASAASNTGDRYDRAGFGAATELPRHPAVVRRRAVNGETAGQASGTANPFEVGVAIFDVNETILDLAPVRRVVDELVGRPGAFALWFARLIQTSMAVTATGDFRDFPALGRATLEALDLGEGLTLPADAWDRVAAAMGALDPHPDVVAGLDALAAAGWTLLALTNSARRSVESQLVRTGLAERFAHILSVDEVRAFKPAAAPYEAAARAAGIAPSGARMVACHDWDLAGARAVGMSTCFVARRGMAFSAAFPAPDRRVADFTELPGALSD